MSWELGVGSQEFGLPSVALAKEGVHNLRLCINVIYYVFN